MSHRCHAKQCNHVVPPKMLMCLPHWRMVPGDLQHRVWETYVPGQEVTKTPTREYLDAARDAIEVVAAKEKLYNA